MTRSYEEESLPRTKHTLNLYEGDFERLRELHPEVGASLVIRKIVRKYIRDTEPKVRLPKVDVAI